jgi:cytochrome b
MLYLLQQHNGAIMMSIHIFAVVIAIAMIAVVAASLCLTAKFTSRKNIQK